MKKFIPIIKQLIYDHKIVEARKLYNEETGCGLIEARIVILRMQKEVRLKKMEERLTKIEERLTQLENINDNQCFEGSI